MEKSIMKGQRKYLLENSYLGNYTPKIQFCPAIQTANFEKDIPYVNSFLPQKKMPFPGHFGCG